MRDKISKARQPVAAALGQGAAPGPGPAAAGPGRAGPGDLTSAAGQMTRDSSRSGSSQPCPHRCIPKDCPTASLVLPCCPQPQSTVALTLSSGTLFRGVPRTVPCIPSYHLIPDSTYVSLWHWPHPDRPALAQGRHSCPERPVALGCGRGSSSPYTPCSLHISADGTQGEGLEGLEGLEGHGEAHAQLSPGEHLEGPG